MPLPNTPLDFSTLIAPVPAATIRTTLVNVLLGLSIRADLWPYGGAASSVLTDVAEMGETFATSMVDAISAGWLPKATKGWLRWLAFYVYGITPQVATFASGVVTLSNSGGGVYSLAPGAVTFQNARTGQNYTNTTAISLAAGPGATQPNVGIAAVVAGTIGNANPGEVTTLVTPLLGVTVSNPFAVLGIDAWSDEFTRMACWNSLGARSVRGPRTAYDYAIQVATNTLSGAPVNINRRSIPTASHNGSLAIVVASPQGAPDSNDVTGVATSIELVARPEGVQVAVSGAVAVAYPGTVTVYLPATPGLVAATVQAAVASALALFFQNSPIGGAVADGFSGVHGSGVAAAAGSAYPGIFAVDLPPGDGLHAAGDFTLSAGQVPTDGLTVVARLV